MYEISCSSLSFSSAFIGKHSEIAGGEVTGMSGGLSYPSHTLSYSAEAGYPFAFMKFGPSIFLATGDTEFLDKRLKDVILATEDTEKRIEKRFQMTNVCHTPV